MKQIIYATACERDLRKMAKSGKDLSKFLAVVNSLAQGVPLARKHKPHPLKGSLKPKWDCHIELDWLLLYEIRDNALYLFRTGTHSELF